MHSEITAIFYQNMHIYTIFRDLYHDAYRDESVCEIGTFHPVLRYNGR